MRYQCSICGFIYDETAGIPDAGIAAGTTWDQLPDDWTCPLCGAPKDSFEPMDEAPPKAAPAASAPAAASTASASDLHEFTPGELAALCSSLARACKQQYLHDQSAKFAELSQYFKGKVPDADTANLVQLIHLVQEDLNSGFPESQKIAAEAGDRGARRPLGWAEKVTRMQKSLIERFEREGDAMLENTNVWVCTACGFIFVGENPPQVCPVCKVPAFKFDKVERG